MTSNPTASVANSCSGPANGSGTTMGSGGANTGNATEAQTSEPNSANPYEKPKRQKTSSVWDHFEVVTKQSGVKENRCKYCNKVYKAYISGVTTTMRRHLESCVLKPSALLAEGQQQLNLVPTLNQPKSGISVKNFIYDQSKVREIMSHCFIVHELPFITSEYELFNLLLRTISPNYQKISRTTIQTDVFKTYEIHKEKIKKLIHGVTRMSLTTDLWQSVQTVGYMVVTCHFVDKNFKLQKRVLDFCNIPPPHTGVAIADALQTCLADWDIEKKVWTITVDNASCNDVAVRNLKETLSFQGRLPLDGDVFHVRCCAHIINILVQCGLKEIAPIIENVRKSVKYIAASESRINMFRDIAKQLKLSGRKLILDCPTRWNSTYNMISTACDVKVAFARYAERDSSYVWLPSEEQWQLVLDVCNFLELFNDITTHISASDYPTANLFLPELWDIKKLLNETLLSENENMQSMASEMLEKFDKYWGNSNLIISMGAVLDPRNKFQMLQTYFPDLYNGADSSKEIKLVRDKLYQLYHEYYEDYRARNIGNSSEEDSDSVSSTTTTASASSGVGRRRMGRAKFDSMVRNVDSVTSTRSELDVYLEDGLYIDPADADLNVIEWWKEHRMRYKVLSKMACDILAIPITSVASEATFSAGGRVIDPSRASLGKKTVKALLCSEDWLRNHYGLKRSVKALTKKEVVVEVDFS